MAGSTRQQIVGRINKVADCGDGDEDEDEDKDEDEIPRYAVLVNASVERFGVYTTMSPQLLTTYNHHHQHNSHP